MSRLTDSDSTSSCLQEPSHLEDAGGIVSGVAPSSEQDNETSQRKPSQAQQSLAAHDHAMVVACRTIPGQVLHGDDKHKNNADQQCNMSLSLSLEDDKIAEMHHQSRYPAQEICEADTRMIHNLLRSIQAAAPEATRESAVDTSSLFQGIVPGISQGKEMSRCLHTNRPLMQSPLPLPLPQPKSAPQQAQQFRPAMAALERQLIHNDETRRRLTSLSPSLLPDPDVDEPKERVVNETQSGWLQLQLLQDRVNSLSSSAAAAAAPSSSPETSELRTAYTSSGHRAALKPGQLQFCEFEHSNDLMPGGTYTDANFVTGGGDSGIGLSPATQDIPTTTGDEHSANDGPTEAAAPVDTTLLLRSTEQLRCMKEPSHYPHPPRASKKTKDKPKRNLSAYNFFFREERQRLLEELGQKQPALPVHEVEPPKLSDNPRGPNSKKTPHHMIGFQSMGKVIGARWKALCESDRKRYMDMAAQDKERYDKDKANMKHEAEVELTRKRQQQELGLDPETKRRYLENDWRRS